MTASALGAQRLRYFIHDDFDAFRMELREALSAPAARRANEDWRVARLWAHCARVVVDIKVCDPS